MPIVVPIKKGETVKFEQAQEDIVVYKVLLRNDKTLKLKSLFHNYSWNRRSTQKTKIGVFIRTPNYLNKKREFLVSNTGFYSFCSEKAAQRYHEIYKDVTAFKGNSLVTIKSTIPKGSMYYRYKDQCISEELSIIKRKTV